MPGGTAPAISFFLNSPTIVRVYQAERSPADHRSSHGTPWPSAGRTWPADQLPITPFRCLRDEFDDIDRDRQRRAHHVAVVPMRIAQLGVGLEPHDDLRARGPVEWVIGLELGQLVGDRQEQAIHAVVPSVGESWAAFACRRAESTSTLLTSPSRTVHVVVVGLPAGDRPFQVVIADAGLRPELLGLFDSLGRYLLAAGAAADARPTIARMPSIAKLRNQDACGDRFIVKRLADDRVDPQSRECVTGGCRSHGSSMPGVRSIDQSAPGVSVGVRPRSQRPACSSARIKSEAFRATPASLGSTDQIELVGVVERPGGDRRAAADGSRQGAPDAPRQSDRSARSTARQPGALASVRRRSGPVAGHRRRRGWTWRLAWLWRRSR